MLNFTPEERQEFRRILADTQRVSEELASAFHQLAEQCSDDADGE